MIQLRYFARHPLFLPLVGIFAVLVTAVVLQTSGVTRGVAPDRAAVSGQQTPAAPKRAEVSVTTGKVAELQLARDGAAIDRVRVTNATDTTGTWLVLTAQSRVLVPDQQRLLVGSPLDLAVGQPVSVELEPGALYEDGARVARLRVGGAAALAPVAD